MIYSGRFSVTSPYGQRWLNGASENHKGIDVVGIEEKITVKALNTEILFDIFKQIFKRPTLTSLFGAMTFINGSAALTSDLSGFIVRVAVVGNHKYLEVFTRIGLVV